MHTAILHSESESDFQQVMELTKKLNIKTRIISSDNIEDIEFYNANESALSEWLTIEEDEAWKNL